MKDKFRPTSDELAFASQVIARYNELEAANKDANRLLKQITWQQAARDEPLTAMYTLEDGTLNPAYTTQYERDIQQFLHERIHGKVLDIGSGGRDELKGVVPDEQVVYVDRENFPQQRFIQADVLKGLPFSDDEFDSAFSRRVMDSTRDIQAMLPEIMRVTKSHGTIVLCPNNGFLLDNLRGLREVGVSIAEQCDIQLVEKHMQHNILPLRFNTPEIYVTIRLNKRK